MQTFQSEILFSCPTCNRKVGYSVDIPEPEWHMMEEPADLYAEGPVLIICPSCKSEFDGYAYVSHQECSIEIEDHPGRIINCEPPYFSPEEDDWINDSIPDNPIQIFQSTIRQIRDHLHKQDGSEDGQFINRMLFCQTITALEAFLGDFIIKQLTPGSVSNLIAKDEDISREKFTLEQINKNPNLVSDHVNNHLKTILYHNLPKVYRIYKIAFDIDIWDPQIDKKSIMKAISLRHDCVHRNGYTADGKWLDVFDNKYIEETMTHLSLLVDHIYNAVNSLRAKEAFGGDF